MTKTVLIGIVLGALCAGSFGCSKIERQAKASANQMNACQGYGKPVHVVVAARPLKAGTRITLDNVGQRLFPGSFATSSIVRAVSIRNVLGKRTLVDLAQGDLLRYTSLAHPLTGGLCAAVCAPGAKRTTPPTGHRP